MGLKAREKGQALVLVALAAVGLFAFAALAIDGTRSYSDKRHAQNAADTSVLAGALAYTRNNSISSADLNNVMLNRSTSNGYNNDGISNQVTITVTDVPAGGCPGGVAGKDITMDIVSYVNTTFARVIGRNQLTNAVTATSRACGFYIAPLFSGHAIVSLNPGTGPCGVDTGNSNSKKWFITGSGVFSNGCLLHTNGQLNIPNDKCLNSVGTAVVTGGGAHICVQQGAQQIAYPAAVDAIMPPNPCGPGGIGLPPPASGATFSNGVYCISDLEALDDHNVTLNNATLYVTDPKFSMKFAGGGGFFGSATQPGGYAGSGPYEKYYMIIARNNAPCVDFNHGDQVIEWRGNATGGTGFTGTVLAPSACLDLRGNADQYAMNSQIIGYSVSTNGNAEVHVNYVAGQNRQDPVQPTISMLK